LYVDNTHPLTKTKIGEQCVGFVVGVGRRLKEGAGNAQLAKRQAKGHVPVVLRYAREGHAVLRLHLTNRQESEAGYRDSDGACERQSAMDAIPGLRLAGRKVLSLAETL
jgi:hypothetical protein